MGELCIKVDVFDGSINSPVGKNRLTRFRLRFASVYFRRGLFIYKKRVVKYVKKRGGASRLEKFDRDFVVVQVMQITFFFSIGWILSRSVCLKAGISLVGKSGKVRSKRI